MGDTGLDYYKQSDAWQDTRVADWDKIDSYVDKGYLTSEERELLQAYGSMVADNSDTSVTEFSEVNAAWSHYLEVNNEHGDEPLAYDPDNSTEMAPPDLGDIDSYDTYTTVFDVADTPKVPNYDAGGGGTTAVNTTALTTFGSNMLELQGMLLTSMDYVELVDVKPGAFHDAYELRDQVKGTGKSEGLKSETWNFMNNAAQTFVDINADIGKVVIDYDTAEELNGLSGEKLGSVMSESFGDISKSTSYGNTKNSGDSSEGSGGDGATSA